MGFSIIVVLALVAAIAMMGIASTTTTNVFAYHGGSSISVTQIINQHNTVKNGGTASNTASNSVTINGHGTTPTQTQTQTSPQGMGTQGVLGGPPINIPANECGNIVNPQGGLNPAFGNTCENP